MKGLETRCQGRQGRGRGAAICPTCLLSLDARTLQFETVRFQAYGGDELLADLQKLFNDSWRHPSSDLRPDIARICEGWKMKQMEAKSMPSGSDGAKVLEQLSASLQQVVSHKGSSGLDGAVLGTSDFGSMRPSIEEAWRQQLNREGGPPASPPSQPSVAQAGGL